MIKNEEIPVEFRDFLFLDYVDKFYIFMKTKMIQK